MSYGKPIYLLPLKLQLQQHYRRRDVCGFSLMPYLMVIMVLCYGLLFFVNMPLHPNPKMLLAADDDDNDYKNVIFHLVYRRDELKQGILPIDFFVLYILLPVVFPLSTTYYAIKHLLINILLEANSKKVIFFSLHKIGCTRCADFSKKNFL